MTEGKDEVRTVSSQMQREMEAKRKQNDVYIIRDFISYSSRRPLLPCEFKVCKAGRRQVKTARCLVFGDVFHPKVSVPF
jgi:hypothetical protein